MNFRLANGLRGFLLMVLILVIACCGLVLAEPPLLLTQEFNDALSLRENSRFQEAVDAFSLIAEENLDKQIGGYAKYQVYAIQARHLSRPEALVALAELIEIYEGTPIGIIGKLSLANENFYDDWDDWLIEFNQLALSFGGATLQQIEDGDVSLRKPDSWTKEEFEYVLLRFYRGLISRLKLEPNSTARSWAVVTFLRSQARSQESQTVTRDLMENLAFIATMKGQVLENPEVSDDTMAPEIEVIEPSINGFSSKVMVRITDGDFTQSQIDYSSIDYRVEQVDYTASLGFTTQSDINSVFILGSTFESLLVEIAVDELLEPGDYVSELRVRDLAENERVVQIPFRIAPKESSQALEADKDSTLRAQKPHRNEGANPRLFLSHRLDARGKSQNPIVGFDLSEADLNGLSSATLVMNIQDCDLPRRWGQDGRFIEAHPVTASWVEGNGNRYRLQGNEGKTKGEGPGATWFSPVDDQIRNNRPNGSEMWNGARNAFGPITAPMVQVTNDQTGPIEFDVTQDLQGLQGEEISWVLKKSDEGEFGNVRFYSKENGNPELAPKLLLEYGGQVAQNETKSNSLLSALGFGINRPMFQLAERGSELPTFREVLQQEPMAAFVGESLVATASGQNPLVSTAAKVAYRAWLS